MKRFRPTMFEEDGGTLEGTKKEKSVRQEKRMAESIGGRVQPGSGSSMYAKADVKHRTYLIECKRTDKKSISVKGAWLKKITEEAFAKEKTPALHLEMDVGGGMTERDWVAVPKSVFVELIGENDA